MKQKIKLVFSTFVELEVDVEPRKGWKDGDRWAHDVNVATRWAVLNAMTTPGYEKTLLRNAKPEVIELPDPVTDPEYGEKVVKFEGGL